MVSRTICGHTWNTVNKRVFKTHPLRLSQTVINIHGHLPKQLHWPPVELRCIFKTGTMDNKFLHTGHPSYFGPFVFIHVGRYCTRNNHPDKRFLEVLEYYSSLDINPSATACFLILIVLLYRLISIY